MPQSWGANNKLVTKTQYEELTDGARKQMQNVARSLAQLSPWRGEFLLGVSGLGVSREVAVSYKFLFF